jgi:transcription-repair coupling factor (superfamily II helicase)
MERILKQLMNEASVRALSNGQGSFAHLSLTQEAALLAATYRRKPQAIFVVKPNLYQAQQLHAKLSTWLNDEEFALFASEESLRVEAIASSPEINVQKMETLSRLSAGSPILCVTHVGAALRHLPSPAFFKQSTIKLSVNQRIEPKDLAERLRVIGYTQVNRVDQPCCFAMRGGILDVYPINTEFPLRIEFFDVEIESLRTFDLSTQRSTEELQAIDIQPASDVLLQDQQIQRIVSKVDESLKREKTRRSSEEYEVLEGMILRDVDYIRNHVKENYLYRYTAFLDDNDSVFAYADDPLVILSPIQEVKDHIRHMMEETVDYIQEKSQDQEALTTFNVFHDLAELLAVYKRVDFDLFETAGKEMRFPLRDVHFPQEPLVQAMKLIDIERKKKHVVLCLKEAEIKSVIEICIYQNLPYTMFEPALDEIGLSILHEERDEGFELTEPPILVLTSKELFQRHIPIGRYANKFKEAETLSSYQDLQIGDFVVHHQHGVGKYLGIITKEIDDVHRDFLHILFRSDDQLFVPLEQFQLVRKFVSRDGVSPKLNKLGSNEWSKTKAKIKENVREIADRLIELYASREKDIAYAFGPDSELQQEFEDEFEYQLTPDQAIAIDEIKADMMKAKPMDRLLCGDVGFGKTEVAIRAAFKAIGEHKQVAFLCPTTVLSRQHYQTFLHRFANFPVNIRLLNRFVIESQAKETLRDVKEGNVDILIGTHRILSKDVKFKDLGLLVIDEEQRFGVEHKEKVKEVKQSVHVLSLSATPIPRTLQMSLIGVRTLSQLDTPPQNRLPVQTYVLHKNKGVIKEVIQRELARNGQVFYLFNNVSQIHSVAYQIKQDIPQAKVAVAHGQMHREEIEDVMYRFTMNEYNVLVCTTIVETGIDIPNANTIIIDRADTFGLSQLYQIKGRVGRSDRLAYAYLMYSPRKQLSEIAQKRLQSIKEFTELGSGYKIAMRDLTIRGAGEMLGDSQSGFIDTVGIDMYIELLSQAITEKRTGIVVEEKEMEVKQNFQIDAYIPKTFAPQDYEKISLYQRIDKTDSEHELKKLQEEITDMYGKLPRSVGLLFEKKRLEILTNDPRILSFKERLKNAELSFSVDWSSSIDGVQLFRVISDLSSAITLKYLGGSIIVSIPKTTDWLTLALAVLDKTSRLTPKGEPDAHR